MNKDVIIMFSPGILKPITCNSDSIWMYCRNAEVTRDAAAIHQ